MRRVLFVLVVAASIGCAHRVGELRFCPSSVSIYTEGASAQGDVAGEALTIGVEMTLDLVPADECVGPAEVKETAHDRR